MNTKIAFKRIILSTIFCFFITNTLYSSTNLITVIEGNKTITQEETFTFAVIGDNQPRGNFGQPPIFKKIISEINNSDAQFVVHLGDKIQGNRNKDIVKKQYAEFLDIIKPLKMKLYHTVGNHDVKKSKYNEELYIELFGQTYYSFSIKNAFFIILNTEIIKEEGSIQGKQLEWLKEELEKSKDYRNTFVFMHRPLYSAIFFNRRHTHFASKEDRDNLIELFKKYKVTTVFSGHEHLYHNINLDGLQLITSGGGGAPFHFYPMGNFYHYLIVKVKEKGVTIRAIPVPEE